MAVTIKQVAERANVSKTAVSYVLNGQATQAKIAPETAQRIWEVARELQYRPNALARGLAGKKTRALRVVLQYAQWFSVWSGFTSEMMRGVTAAAYNGDWEVVLHTRRSAQESTESELTHILDGRTDGALLMRDITDPLITQLADRGFPFVLMFAHVDDKRVAAADCDNVQGGRMATEYLLSLGHQRILHVAGGPESRPATDRRRGFVEALQVAGVTPRPDWIVEAWELSHEATFAPVVDALRLPADERPTAVFAWYDGVALRVMQAARELGLRVPEDLSVIGFDGTEMGANAPVPLTTMRQPIVEITEKAVHLVAQQIAGDTETKPVVLFTPELLVRASCAPA